MTCAKDRNVGGRLPGLDVESAVRAKDNIGCVVLKIIVTKQIFERDDTAKQSLHES